MSGCQGFESRPEMKFFLSPIQKNDLTDRKRCFENLKMAKTHFLDYLTIYLFGGSNP